MLLVCGAPAPVTQIANDLEMPAEAVEAVEVSLVAWSYCLVIKLATT